MTIEVKVHPGRCIGIKSCVNSAPGTFAIGRNGISTVLNPEGEPERALTEAAENCPSGAISVFKDGVRIA